MTEISDFVLDSLDVMRRTYDKCERFELRRDIQDAYFRIVDIAYTNDISKTIAYKRLWYTYRTESQKSQGVPFP
jgi:hypothetical protein